MKFSLFVFSIDMAIKTCSRSPFYRVGCEIGNKAIFLGLIKSLDLNRIMRKPVLSHLQTTKAQISQHIHAVWSAPLLFPA